MRSKPAVLTEPSSKGFVHMVQIFPLAINLLVALTTTYTGHASLVDSSLAMTTPSTGHSKELQLPKFLVDSP